MALIGLLVSVRENGVEPEGDYGAEHFATCRLDSKPNPDIFQVSIFQDRVAFGDVLVAHCGSSVWMFHGGIL
ncbi:hypothetical protein NB99_19125 [Xanthomonas citri pv. fuscans]|nr:hypothetical protein NB99_19125 [Xanthomonas citri pv. fuscans]